MPRRPPRCSATTSRCRAGEEEAAEQARCLLTWPSRLLLGAALDTRSCLAADRCAGVGSRPSASGPSPDAARDPARGAPPGSRSGSSRRRRWGRRGRRAHRARLRAWRPRAGCGRAPDRRPDQFSTIRPGRRSARGEAEVAAGRERLRLDGSRRPWSIGSADRARPRLGRLAAEALDEALIGSISACWALDRFAAGDLPAACSLGQACQGPARSLPSRPARAPRCRPPPGTSDRGRPGQLLGRRRAGSSSSHSREGMSRRLVAVEENRIRPRRQRPCAARCVQLAAGEGRERALGLLAAGAEPAQDGEHAVARGSRAATPQPLLGRGRAANVSSPDVTPTSPASSRSSSASASSIAARPGEDAADDEIGLRGGRRGPAATRAPSGRPAERCPSRV